MARLGKVGWLESDAIGRPKWLNSTKKNRNSDVANTLYIHYLLDRASIDDMDDRLRQIAKQLMKFTRANDVKPCAIGTQLLPHLFVLEIEPHAKLSRLRVRLVGTALDQLFGRDLKGRYLEDFIHGPRGKDVIDGFHRVALSHAPLWMRQYVRMTDRAPRFVEGVVVHLLPNRLYGGLVAGELASRPSLAPLATSIFESREIVPKELACEQVSRQL